MRRPHLVGGVAQTTAFSHVPIGQPMPQDCRVPTSAITDALLTLRESAAFLQCSTRTIHRLVQQGRLRRRSVGRCPRFLRSDLLTATGGAS